MELEYTKKEYEISIYKNELSSEYTDDEAPQGIKRISYFKQNKIAMIGTNKYKSPIDAYSPKFTININGKKTLTFNMSYKYYDYNEGDYKLNPLVSLIHNDTLIELKLDGEYYDLLITKIQKNTDNSVYNYTAEDAHIIELGKNGFNAELALELENNMGTVNYLGEKILEGCDWQVAPNDPSIKAPYHSDLIIQTLEDSLYKIQVENLQFEKRTDYLPDAYYIHDERIVDYTEEYQPITGTIYAFYNDIVDKDKQEIGFLYWNGEEESAILNADGTVVNSYNYVTTDVSVRELQRELSLMRGRRVVKMPKTFFDEDLGKTVTCFRKANDDTEYYGYAETDYMSPILVENYISNPCNMTSIYDWNYVNMGERLDTHPRLLMETMPKPTGAPYVSYLSIDPDREVVNKGLQGHRTNIESLVSGDKFVLAFLHHTEGYYDIDSNNCNIDGTNFPMTNLSKLQYSAGFYRYEDLESEFIVKYSNPNYDEEGTFFTGTFIPNATKSFTIVDQLDPRKRKVYYYNIITYDGESITDLTEHFDGFLGFFIKNTDDEKTPLYETMFFRYRTYNNEIVWPGKIFTRAPMFQEGDTDTRTPLCRTYYNIYKDVDGKSILQARTLNTDDYSIVYNDSCEKVSYLTDKEKNYYTLLSNLTKTFECWMEPKIEREDGKIVYKPCYYGPEGQVLQYSNEPVEATAENINKFYLNANNEPQIIVKRDRFKWRNLTLTNPPSDETDIYMLEENGETKPIPIKTISYVERFERFNSYKEENSNDRVGIPKALIDGKYSMNYLYIVEFEGEDTEPAPGHPRKEYYILEPDVSIFTESNSVSVLKKPSKWIVFRNYLNDTPNWAGFKYGINVRSIQRIEDNTNFATKVIVKNNANEFSLNQDKMCSIARAVNNPTRDNFILDFSYYIRQGMLDKEELYHDLYENYYPALRELNTANETLIDQHVHNSTALDKIQADYETYYLAYNAASESTADYCKKIVNCGDKYAIAPEWDKWNIGGLEPIKEQTYVLMYAEKPEDMKSSINSEIFAGIDFNSENDEAMEWYDLPVIYFTNENGRCKFYKMGTYTESDEEDAENKDSQIVEKTSLPAGYYYIYTEDEEQLKLLGTTSEGEPKYVGRHVYYQQNEAMRPTFTPYYSKADYYWNKALFGYAARIDENILKQQVYGPLYRQYKVEADNKKAEMKQDIKDSIDKVNAKKGILRQFFSKYSDFLRESSWSKEDYIDDELYYLDARDSLHAAAFPKISYNINVIDVDELENMSIYKLRVGDYTFVEDTEFFGWDDKGRPAKEWVVVTEATYDLEQPANNQIKIQNYKTQIEDLFSRLSASLQSLELNKGGYNREIVDRTWPIGTKVDSNGIHSSNYSEEHNTGWALFNDGTYFFGAGNLTSP